MRKLFFYTAIKLCAVFYILPIISNDQHNHNTQSVITAEVSYGELIDKITILRIKQLRITDPVKIKNIVYELTSLEKTLMRQITITAALQALVDQLQEVNEKLWDIEDAIRIKESKKEFDQEFINLARSVYFTNDHRSNIKRAINELLGSTIFEEKSYEQY